ncbi:MAG: glycosyltransferase family 2 protein [Patescibacteria group bacterium]
MIISTVIPAYNEAKKIGQVINEIKDKVTKIIVVNDGSNDATGEIASQGGAIVLNHFINRGQGAALQTGINFALAKGADIILTFDADGQHQASDIDKMIQPLLLGQVQVVLGSRFLGQKAKMPFVRKVILKLATLFTQLYTGLKVTDTHNGFRAFSRQAAELIEIKQDGMAHASEIIEQIRKYDLKYIEVPVVIEYTDYSLQKGQKLSNSFRIVWDLILGKISR